jgi:oligopeptide transport system ATP-binding protein
MAEKILQVNNLTVSFKTDNGIVKAVRGVSFDLEKGETLCIVGESGSGKSVTSKAIMGILAKNAIVEDGTITYRGENLLEISEEEYVAIRGHKIGMIFQDPLSSLNPIVRIGKQITEATLINNNKLKKMFEELVSNEYMEYKNIYSSANARITKLNNKLDAEIASLKKQIKEDPSKKADLNAQIKSLKEENKKEVKSIKDEMNKKGKEAKIKLNAASKVAKEKVNEYHKQVNDQYKNDVDEVNKNYENDVALINEKFANYNPQEELSASNAKLEEANKRLEEKQATLNSIDKLETEKYKAYQDEIASIKEEIKNINKEISDINNAKDIVLKEALNTKKTKLKEAKEKHTDALKITKKEAKRRALEIMKEVGIPQPDKRYKQYPFELSGGMRQRIVIAIALTADPEVLICDEPTTALDVTIQAQILELINKLKRERNLSCIFITHDLGVVANMADRVAVMYAGKIVEYGKVDEIFYDPRHPYTWALLSSIPDVDSNEKLDAIQGTPPNMIYPPKGDAFAARNKYAMEIDFKYQPPFFKVTDTHYAATWLLHPDAPKVEKPKIVTERINKALKVGVTNENRD